MNEDTKLVEDDSTPGTSLTRRKALGVGALAVGGAAIGSLVAAESAQAAVAGTTGLKSAAAAGATTITVKSVNGLAVGYTIWIGTNGAGTSAESVRIVSVNTMTLKLGLSSTTPLQQSHAAGARVSVIPPVAVAPGVFKDVLKKLVNDSAYCSAAVSSPQMITTDYPSLTPLELEALRDCAALSGADMSAINSARADALASGASGDKVVISIPPKGWAPGCCSCCCCL